MLEQKPDVKVLGLIGYPLSHSFSEQYFAAKFRNEGIRDYLYRNYPIAGIDLVGKLISDERRLAGFNVTIPYKEQIIPLLDDVDDEAHEIGAVNTVTVTRKGGKIWLKGYNTDAYGFRESLMPLLGDRDRRALVLGTGGASKAVCHVLRQLGIAFTYVSRTDRPDGLTYRDLCLSVIKNHTLIINTTPLGTWPDISSFADIPYDILTEDHLLYDLVYNPPETTFLKFGRKKGARTKNGLEMLRLQADRSWEIWTGKE